MTGSVKQAFAAPVPAKNGAASPKQRGDGRAFGDAFRASMKEPAATARRAGSAAPQPATSLAQPGQSAAPVRSAANLPATDLPAAMATATRYAPRADERATAAVQSGADPAAAALPGAGRAVEPATMPHSAIIERMRQTFPRDVPDPAPAEAAANPVGSHAAAPHLPAEPSGQYRDDPIGAVLSDLNERLRSLTSRPLPAPSESAAGGEPAAAQGSATPAMPEDTVSADAALSRPTMRAAVEVPAAEPESRATSGAERSVKSESALSIASNPARPKPPGTEDLPPRRTERPVHAEAVRSQEHHPSNRSEHAAAPAAPQTASERPSRRNIDIAAVTQPASPREALRALLTQLERKSTAAEPAQPREAAQEKAAPLAEAGRREMPARPVSAAATDTRPQRDPQTHAARSQPEAPATPPAGNAATSQHPAAARSASETRTAADARPLLDADVFDIAGVDPDLLRAALALAQPETAADGAAASAKAAPDVPAAPSIETPHAAPATTASQRRAETPAHRSSDAAIMPQAGRTAAAGPADLEPAATGHAERKDEDAPAVVTAPGPREPSPARQEALHAAEQPASSTLTAQAPILVAARSAAPAAAQHDGRAPVVASPPGIPDRQGARETSHTVGPATTDRTQPQTETSARPVTHADQPAMQDIRPTGTANEARISPAPVTDGTPHSARADAAASSARPQVPAMDGMQQAATPDTARAEVPPRAPAPAATGGQAADVPASEPAPDRAAARADRPAQGDDFEPLTASARPAAADARFVARVSVETAQSMPAPAAAGTPVPIADLATALAADPTWKSMAGTHAGFQAFGGHSHLRHASTLRIELKPAELGAVTAELKLVGDQLSVTISVDTQEAYQRLSQDQDSIVQSLRGLGLQVDQVSIQQPQIANRADQGNTSFNAGPREPGSSASGQPGDGQGQQGARNQSGASRDESYNPASQARRGTDAGGGLYI